jgi:hypothetical protein
MSTIFLLVLSNVFMTFAWNGHLKYASDETNSPLAGGSRANADALAFQFLIERVLV